jgi:hypothetical protein
MNIRSLLMASVLGLAVVIGLWGIWVFESRSAGKDDANTGEFSYQLTQKPGEGPADVIVMCDEDVMSAAGDAFAKWLKLEGIPLKAPGGVMLISRLNDVTLDSSLKPLQRALVEVLKRYSPRRVVLVAHTYCIYYDTVAAWNDDLAKVRQRQIADMRASMNVLREWFPRAEISGYLAEEDANHKLVFHSATKVGL